MFAALVWFYEREIVLFWYRGSQPSGNLGPVSVGVQILTGIRRAVCAGFDTVNYCAFSYITAVLEIAHRVFVVGYQAAIAAEKLFGT